MVLLTSHAHYIGVARTDVMMFIINHEICNSSHPIRRRLWFYFSRWNAQPKEWHLYLKLLFLFFLLCKLYLEHMLRLFLSFLLFANIMCVFLWERGEQRCTRSRKYGVRFNPMKISYSKFLNVGAHKSNMKSDEICKFLFDFNIYRSFNFSFK